MKNTDNTLRLAIGQLLKRKRQEKKLSLQQLSLLVYGNIGSQNNISKIENGKIATNVDTLEKISLALGFNLTETFNNI